MKGNIASGSGKTLYPTVSMLQKSAAAMLPFYKRIATDASFAQRWSQAVRRADLQALLRLFRQTSPVRPGRYGFGTNSIGYFLDLHFPQPIVQYTNGTSQQPGSAQFQFNTKAHRRIARAVLVLYRTIVCSRPFAAALAEAVRRGDAAMVERLVRTRVHSPYLRSVDLLEAGFALRFRIPGVRNEYANEFFREYSS